MDKKRALQKIKLVSRQGVSVDVTFQLSKHQTEQGECWLIDQLLGPKRPEKQILSGSA